MNIHNVKRHSQMRVNWKCIRGPTLEKSCLNSIDAVHLLCKEQNYTQLFSKTPRKCHTTLLLLLPNNNTRSFRFLYFGPFQGPLRVASVLTAELFWRHMREPTHDQPFDCLQHEEGFRDEGNFFEVNHMVPWDCPCNEFQNKLTLNMYVWLPQNQSMASLIQTQSRGWK